MKTWGDGLFASSQEQLVLTVLHGQWSPEQAPHVAQAHGITPEQFNILRILRGQKDAHRLA